MKITYDPRYNIAYIIAYIRLRDKTEGVETIRISDELHVALTRWGDLWY